MAHFRSLAITASAGLVFMGLAAPAMAQVSQSVNQSLLESWRLQSGDVVRFCHYEDVPTGPFDRAVGQEIANRLLLESEFSELGSGYAIGGEYAAEDLFVTMTNDCDVMLGMGLAANAYPQEFTVTRPYAGFPYVLVVDEEGVASLSDIPADQRLGAPVGSYGLREVLRFTATRPEDQRWQTLPYGEDDLMLTRLLDDTIGGMVMYGPSYVDLTQENPEATDLSVLSLQPELRADIEIGGVMLARNSFLRTLIDAAIADMVADGTIEALIAETGFDGIQAQPGGFSGN